MNPLNSYPTLRKWAYVVQWVTNGVLAVAGVVFATLGTTLDDLPAWYVLALAVAPALWTYLGLTASNNVDTEPGEEN